jgi:hypothetical protein
MKGFLQRLFGGDRPSDKTSAQQEFGSSLEIEPYSRPAALSHNAAFAFGRSRPKCVGR